MLRKFLLASISISSFIMTKAQDGTVAVSNISQIQSNYERQKPEKHAIDSLIKGPDSATVSAPASSPLSTPGMTGPLSINPKPLNFKIGHKANIYVSGALSGIYQWQNNVIPGDKESQIDLSNGQVFVQKADGVIQFFIQAGWYSMPDIGVPYMKAEDATKNFFGVIPQGFLKIAPSANFSIMAGKLPTLIGAEYTFSFENMNIQRGLLWNQENAVNRGVQVNYKTGKLSLAVSWNDGFYSNQYTWGWLSAAYTINPTSTLTFIGSGNTGHSSVSSIATPLYLNNEQLFNLIYSKTYGNWTFSPYLQYTRVPKGDVIKTTQDASTFGAALLANYSLPSASKMAGLSFPFRLEYINSTGSTVNGAPNLMYGPGSSAWSATITPTYQYKQFFGRAEYSYVKASNITSGSAFGPTGDNSTQSRFLLELGILF